MARTTDRQHVSEAVRKAIGWHSDWISRNTVMLRSNDVTQPILQVSYSENGRITDLYRASANGQKGGRIHANRRASVLKIVAGEA